MKRLAYAITLLLIGAALGSAGMALAANKQVNSTLVPPTGITSGGYSICITNNAALGAVGDTLIVTTRACGLDGVTKHKECADNAERTKTPPAEMISFINTRLANWRTANGY